MRDLYPPILPSYIPAFDYNNVSQFIYFNFSHYNSFQTDMCAQVTIRYQSNNASALDPNQCPIDILELKINKNTDNYSSYPYYIILSSDMLAKGFEPEMLYKIQIRLSSVSCNGKITPSFIRENNEKFSEWSSVCLLKSIIKPSLQVKELKIDKSINNGIATKIELKIESGDAVFTGLYSVADNSDEMPSSWRMQLYHTDDGQIYDLISDSGYQVFNTYDYTNVQDNSFPFQHDFQLLIEEKQKYKLLVTAISKNNYELEEEYYFEGMKNINFVNAPSIEATPNDEEGYMKVSIVNQVVGTYILTLRRSSSKTNFQKWEDLTNVNIFNNIIKVTFYDYAIEDGVFYSYSVQSRDNNYKRTSNVTPSTPKMCNFEYAYLLGYNQGLLGQTQQLKLAYNVNISSFATTLSESKVDTLGSKYPFITRNGDIYYKTFTISGLISYHMNEVETPGEFFSSYIETNFTSREEEYGNSYDIVTLENDNNSELHQAILRHEKVGVYNKSNPHLLYNEMYDFTYERLFREKVMEFLYNNKPKLFKSASEGNILIKLMDISFTPKEELGRLIYDFSATAYEIEEPTLENLNKYDIQVIMPYTKNAENTSVYIGQLNVWDNDFNILWNANSPLLNIISVINKKHHIGETWNDINRVVEETYLSYLKITFESPPYLIKKPDLIPFIPEELTPGETPIPGVHYLNDEDGVMGWLIYYDDNEKILVTYPNNVYEFKSSILKIFTKTAVVGFPAFTEATIDYLITTVEHPASMDKIIKRQEFKEYIGQVYQIFKPEIDFISTIDSRYGIIDNDIEFRKINCHKSLDIEADPGTVVVIEQPVNITGEIEKGIHRFVINFTGRLLLDPDVGNNFFLQGYFLGKNVLATDLKYQWEDSSTNPIDNKICELDYYLNTLDNTIRIFYLGQWRRTNYVADNDSYDIKCPVDGIVNYYLEIVQGEYEQAS